MSSSRLGGGGWIRLIVCFQPLMVISPTANWIRWYKCICRCRCGDLMWSCLVWADRSTPDNFWVPNHQFNSATGEQKGVTQTIYTDSEPPSRMPNSLMPSAKLRSAYLAFLRLWSKPATDTLNEFRILLHTSLQRY